MSVKIKAYTLENFKRVREIHFEPEEAGLFLIGGKNREGKTSSLDGIPWLLGGAKFAPTNAKNTDSTGNLYGKITLSNGITVERGGKNGSLKVTDPTGAKAGQELLNEFVSALALDLPKFLHASDKEKAMILLDTLGIKDKLDELDKKEKITYDERTEIGRVALSLRKHADEMPYFHDAPKAEQSAGSIIARQQEAVRTNNAHAEIRRKAEQSAALVIRYKEQLAAFQNLTATKKAELEKHQAEYRHLDERIRQFESRVLPMDAVMEIQNLAEKFHQYQAEYGNVYDMSRVIESLDSAKQQIDSAVVKHTDILLAMETERRKIMEEWITPAETELKNRETRLAEAKKTIAEAEADQKKCAAEAEALPADIDLAVFQSDIETLEAENAKFRANVAHDKAAAEATAQEAEYERYTKLVEDIRRERMQILDSVKMPLPGLTVKDSLLYYKGQRWDGMSGSERMIVAASIVRAVKPECGFVLMDQLEAMDLDTLDEFNAWLKQENLQVIATRVSSGSECSILIVDGMIQE